MIYNNNAVRRQDRLLPESEACQLLQTGEYGILSMITPDGNPYGIPVNYVWDKNDKIYIHCAPEGKKLSSILQHSQVSFCIIGHTSIAPDKFTTGYKSIIIKCSAHIGLNENERMLALKLLLQKYSPCHQEIGLKYAEKSFHRTEIICLEIHEFSGKCKRLPNP